MIKFVVILILSFCVFIASLIFFTRKEEKVEKELKESSEKTKGSYLKAERKDKSFSNGNLTLIYTVYYQYQVENTTYVSKIDYEVPSESLEPFPEEVEVYYSSMNPKNSMVVADLENSAIKEKEQVKSLLPSIVVAILFGLILSCLLL